MTDDTITRDELAAYFKRHDSSSLAAEASAAMAARIFADVGEQREPAYEPGSAYQDARRDVYLRSSIGDWVSYSGTRHRHGLPARPLLRLVPEGSTAMLLATKLNAIRDLCEDTELLSARQALAIINGEGTCPGGC